MLFRPRSCIPLVLVALGSALPARVQSLTLVEDDFEQGEVGEPPEGWISPSMGPRAKIVDEDGGDARRFARLDLSEKNDALGNLIGSTQIGLEQRSRVVLRAAVRVDASKGGHAQLWLRFDYEDGTYVLADNMQDRPIQGGDWVEGRIVAEVLPKPCKVVYGLLGFEGACVDLDDVLLEVVGPVECLLEPPRPVGERELANLVAFARLYGIVRYFHPSDEASTADWERFAIEGVRRVAGVADGEELRAALSALFAPVAPSVVVHASGSEPPLVGEWSVPPADDSTSVRSWRHEGMGPANGPAKVYEVYKSQRRTLRLRDGALPEGVADPARPFRAEFGSGLACAVPLALYSTHDGTLPRGTPEAGVEEEEKDELALTGTLQSAHAPEDRATRLAAVVVAWNVFQHFYPYFDVLPFDGVPIDWPAELERALRAAGEDADALAFGRTLQRLVAALHDGHGGVYHQMLGATGVLPIGWVPVDGEWVLSSVDPALAGKLARGEVLLAIDGRPVAEVVAELEARVSAATPQFLRYKVGLELLQGAQGKSVRLSVRHGEDPEPIDVTLTYGHANGSPREGRPEVVSELEPGLWYVDLGAVSTEQFLERLDELVDARGVVFDMRGYPRGLDPFQFFSHLIDEPVESPRWLVPILTRPDREGLEFDSSSWTIQAVEPRIPGKLVFLIDGRAISYAETCMGIVEHYRLGEIVGEATAGTNGNVNPFTLPGGYRVSWTGMLVQKHDGSRHHGVGILPTHPVRRTRAGIAAGKDEILEAGLALLRQ